MISYDEEAIAKNGLTKNWNFQKFTLNFNNLLSLSHAIIFQQTRNNDGLLYLVQKCAWSTPPTAYHAL